MKSSRWILLIIFLSGVNMAANSQEKGTKDKIRSIVVLEEKNDMLVKKQYKESETYFDIHGNILEEIKYNQGKVIKHFKYQYDSDNNKIREEELDPSGRATESSEYKFENGLRVEKITFDQNKKIKSKKTYNYTKF
jgi:hypothetical protein